MTSIGMGHITASGRSRHAGTVFAVKNTRWRARRRLTGGMENKRARIMLRRRASLERGAKPRSVGRTENLCLDITSQ